MKLGKEFKIKNNNFLIKWGTINRLKPTSIYFELSSWVLTDNIDNNQVKNLIKTLKIETNKFINNNVLFDKNYIIDFDFKKNNLKKNKKSYLTIETTFFGNNNSPIEIKNAKVLINNYLSHLLNTLNKTENIFTLVK